MARWRAAPIVAGVLGSLLCLGRVYAEPAATLDQAASTLGTLERAVTALAQSPKNVGPTGLGPRDRVVLGELLLRNRDYERAIVTFAKVVELAAEGRVDEATAADAQFFLAEAYLATGQHRSAGAEYGGIFERAARPGFRNHAARAASRLVDVALRTGHLEALEPLIAALERLSRERASTEFTYPLAKAYFAAKVDDQAARLLATVTHESPSYYQALYLRGALKVREHTRKGAKPEGKRLGTAPTSPALESALGHFQALTALPRDDRAHSELVDLAWLAIGRIHFETERLLDAALAYSQVAKDSPEFPQMLLELAWVYARLSDYQRSQRALELLSVAEPQSLGFAEGALLRADLLLRSGQFDRALSLYQSVLVRFGPVTDKLEKFLASTRDPLVFYERLVSERTETSGDRDLPPFVIAWAKQNASSNQALSIVENVARSRVLVRESRSLAAKLGQVLDSPARVKVFPELRERLSLVLQLTNQLSLVRLGLAQALDEVLPPGSPSASSGDRARRRALMERIAALPSRPADFVRREGAGNFEWDMLSQRLQQLGLEVDRQNAIVNGLRRVMSESEKRSLRFEPGTRRKLSAEIDANLKLSREFEAELAGLREAILIGRLTTGLGDARYAEDAALRQAFARSFERELSTLSKAELEAATAQLVVRARGVLARLLTLEHKVEQMRAELERVTMERALELRTRLRGELEAVEAGAGALEQMDATARADVGRVAKASFETVLAELMEVSKKADMGVVAQSWEVREERRRRVNELMRERAGEDQALSRELREVLDEAEVLP
jgi:tetratricopeptide (TPR) repeat protein